MSHAAITAMDPTNPRWQTSDQRTKRSATIWKIIVAAAGASALTAVVVASCLDRDVARRDLDEPGFVETTSATTTATPVAGAPTTAAASTPATTRDSTGGIAPNGADNGGAEIPAGAPSSATTITSAPMSMPAQPRQQSYSPVPVPFERANGDSSTSGTAGTTGTTDAGNVHRAGPNAGPTGSNINPSTIGTTEAAAASNDAGPNAGHASHANNDPNNRGSNPESPPMTSGAGRFVTEAPYWSSSAWMSNPEAGAGPFETERNTPAH